MKIVSKLDNDRRYIRLDKRFFLAPFDYFLPDFPLTDSHRKFWSFYSSVTEDRYEIFIQKFTILLFQFFDARALIAPNYVYRWLQFPLIALREQVPRIILYKEGVVPISTYDSFVEHYTNGRIEADYLGVLNHDLAHAFQRSNISGIDTTSIHIVGSPRIVRGDIQEKVARDRDNKCKFRCVFFSFSLRNNLRHVPHQPEPDEVEQIYIRYLADVEFICKTFPNLKFGYRNKVSVEQMDFKGLEGCCPNLHDVSAWSIDDVFCETEIVVSGPSTVLFEAASRNIHTVEANLGLVNIPTLFGIEEPHPLRYENRISFINLIKNLPCKPDVSNEFVDSYFPYTGHESVERIKEIVNEATDG